MTQEQILALLRKSPGLTAKEIAVKLDDIHLSTVRKELNKLHLKRQVRFTFLKHEEARVPSKCWTAVEVK